MNREFAKGGLVKGGFVSYILKTNQIIKAPFTKPPFGNSRMNGVTNSIIIIITITIITTKAKKRGNEEAAIEPSHSPPSPKWGSLESTRPGGGAF